MILNHRNRKKKKTFAKVNLPKMLFEKKTDDNTYKYKYKYTYTYTYTFSFKALYFLFKFAMRMLFRRFFS